MIGDTANRLVWNPAGVVHFHIKTHSTQREEWDKTIQKEGATILPRPVSTYNFSTTSCVAHKLNPHNLVSQDRAHSVIRPHWKYTKHRRHGNLFNPGWQTTSVLLRFTPPSTRREALGDPQPHLHQQTSPPRWFILVEVLNLFTKQLYQCDHSMASIFFKVFSILTSGVWGWLYTTRN
jgi:hypothetical protein